VASFFFGKNTQPKQHNFVRKVLVLSQLKLHAGKGFQTGFLFQKDKKIIQNVLKLSKTSCFDIQRKFVFWSVAS